MGTLRPDNLLRVVDPYWTGHDGGPLEPAALVVGYLWMEKVIGGLEEIEFSRSRRLTRAPT